MSAMVQTEQEIDRTILNELVVWVKTLREVGVSPDKAVDVAQKFFLAASDECEELSEYEEEYEED